jgi:hypothetical protein
MDDDAVVGHGRTIRWAAFGGVGRPASNDAILFLGVAGGVMLEGRGWPRVGRRPSDGRSHSDWALCVESLHT